MTGPTRIWEATTLPTTPPTAFSKANDIVFLPDATAYKWINAKWQPVTPSWAAKPSTDNLLKI
jgi:hypothetical protein